MRTVSRSRTRGSLFCGLFLLLGAFVVLCSPLWAQGQGVPAPSPNGPSGVDINDALSLVDSDVVDLTLPEQLGGFHQIEVPVAGENLILEIVPHSVRAPGFTVKAVVDNQETELDPGPVATFRGTVEDRKGAQVAGALLEDGLWAQIIFADGSMYWVEPLAGRVVGYESGQHAVYQGEAVIPKGDCGVAGVSLTPQPFGGSGCGGDFCVTQIACDADFEYFTDQGSSTSRTRNRIELVINTVALQYERDVQITYRIGTILVRTSQPDPYTSSDPNTLLDQFRDEWNANQGSIARDVAHLFTGRNIDGTVIGIAFVGVICTDDAYGLSQSDWSSNFALVADLTAHELGHNWDANHCSCSNPDFTMNPGITGANRFRTTGTPDSVADIIAHRNSRGCLDGGVINDNCDNALPVCVGTYNGDSTFATQDGSASCGTNANLDLWYSYTPQFSGSATFDTEGSTGLTDTVLSVHSGCLGTTSNELECDDFSGTGLLSTITMNVTAGETYLLRVCGFGNGAGAFQLNIAGPSCEPPVHDDCADAFDICPGEYYGTTESATTDGVASCATSGASPDVWYRYTPRFSGLMVIDTCGSDYDTALGVYSSCPATLANELACDDDGGPCGLRSRIELDVTGGVTYLIRVTGYDGNSGPFLLSLSGPQCENDDCDLALAIGPGSYYGSLLGGSSDGESLCGSTAENPDVYYEFTAPFDGIFFANTCGTHDLTGQDSNVDTVVSVHSACPATTANQILCDDDWFMTDVVPCGDQDQGVRRDSSVSMPTVAGEVFLIRVSHFGSSDLGPFVLNVGVIPENDECSAPLDVSSGGSYAGDLSFASNDGAANCGSSVNNADVWYTYTATCSGTLRVDTCGTNDLGGQDLGIDTVLSLHSFCPGNAANQLACNDQWPSADPMACDGVDAGTTDDSAILYSILQGETVLIRVSTWASSPTGPFLLNVGIEPDALTPGSFQNGTFSAGALGWCFIDETSNGSADYSANSAVVTGGSDGLDDAFTYIQQVFTTYDVVAHRITFDWEYTSTNAAGFDEARWDLIDEGTGLSVVSGPLTLADAAGMGTVDVSFSGTGTYSLLLGTFTDDGSFGPGVSTYDNVTFSCDSAAGPFSNGNFSVASGAPWCFTDESSSGSVDFSGGEAVVVGGSDSSAATTRSFIAQTFGIPAGPHDLAFDWSFTSTNSATFDGVYYDVIRVSTGVSAVGGPVNLADATGASGTEVVTLSGGAAYTLVLGTFSTDNFGGPGTSIFDNVSITAQSCDPVTIGACTSTGMGAQLSWTLGATYSEIRVVRDGSVIATLPGTATGYLDSPLAAGSYNYGVIGVCGAQLATPATCSVTIVPSVCDPVSGLVCGTAGGAPSLSWTNGASYDTVEIRRGGMLIAVLAGSSTSFTDGVLPPGAYGYGIRGVCSFGPSLPNSCTVNISPPQDTFVRGDCNPDGGNNVADAIFLLGFVFPSPGSPPNVLTCRDACDANDDGSVNLADVITLLNSLFGVPAPTLPAPNTCGVDPTGGDSLDCDTYAPCP